MDTSERHSNRASYAEYRWTSPTRPSHARHHPSTPFHALVGNAQRHCVLHVTALVLARLGTLRDARPYQTGPIERVDRYPQDAPCEAAGATKAKRPVPSTEYLADLPQPVAQHCDNQSQTTKPLRTSPRAPLRPRLLSLTVLTPGSIPHPATSPLGHSPPSGALPHASHHPAAPCHPQAHALSH